MWSQPIASGIGTWRSSSILIQTLERMDPRFPEPEPGLDELVGQSDQANREAISLASTSMRDLAIGAAMSQLPDDAL